MGGGGGGGGGVAHLLVSRQVLDSCRRRVVKHQSLELQQVEERLEKQTGRNALYPRLRIVTLSQINSAGVDIHMIITYDLQLIYMYYVYILCI